MSWIKANKFVNLLNNTVRGTPVNIASFAIPYSTVSSYSGASVYTSLSSFNLANTNQFYSFTYYPVKASSYIVYTALLDVDGTGVNNYDYVLIFINGTPYSNSYCYRRVSGHEPYSKSQSGVYTNVDGSPCIFSIRATNSAGISMSVGQAYGGGDQGMANRITIFEVQR